MTDPATPLGARVALTLAESLAPDSKRASEAETSIPLRRRSGRNAPKTRELLLKAAAYCFARNSYAHVNVREIAQRAGVTPALINRYFGSKVLLLQELLVNTGEAQTLIFQDSITLSTRLASFMRSVPEDVLSMPGGEHFMISLRSAVSSSMLEMDLESPGDLFLKKLVQMLDGSEREERAALIFNYLIGWLTVSHMAQLTHGCELCLAQAIQACVDARP